MVVYNVNFLLICQYFSSCSDKTGTLLYDEDQHHRTPVMIAAARNHEEAFHCLMEYVNPKKYPLFKAFYAQCEKEAILQVYRLMLAMNINTDSW